MPASNHYLLIARAKGLSPARILLAHRLPAELAGAAAKVARIVPRAFRRDGGPEPLEVRESGVVRAAPPRRRPAAPSLLEVRDLYVEFDSKTGVVPALRGASLELGRARTLALVGASGSGKSVLAQALIGVLPRPPGRITGGSVRLSGNEILGESLKTTNGLRGREIGMVFQDTRNALTPGVSIGRQLGEMPRVHERASESRSRRRAIELLARVGFPDPEATAARYPSELSRELCLRALIAMAVACGPKLLIVDDPVAGLAPRAVARVFKLLSELQRELGFSMLVTARESAAVARIADGMLTLHAGRVLRELELGLPQPLDEGEDRLRVKGVEARGGTHQGDSRLAVPRDLDRVTALPQA
jgi:ABC-type dipeptide/oligopeptide/nickel transport system ATPase component